MPAVRLGTDTNIRIARFDVVGMDSATSPEFIRHIALCPEERASHSRNDTLPVTHMGPPLEVAGGDEAIDCARLSSASRG